MGAIALACVANGTIRIHWKMCEKIVSIFGFNIEGLLLIGVTAATGEDARAQGC